MGWVKSEGNLADGLTKINKSESIQRTMRTGRLDAIAEQYIIRPLTKESKAGEEYGKVA